MSKSASRPGGVQWSGDESRRLVEQASDIIYQADHNGRLVLFNSTATRKLGYSEEEILGRNHSDLIRPDYRQAVEQTYRRQFIERIPSTYFEFPVVAKDGSEIWLGQNVELLTEGARVLGFQAVARDITERKGTEEKLRVSEARYKALYDANPLMVFTASPAATILSVNAVAAELLGYSREELVGRSFMDTIPGTDREAVLRQITACAGDATQVGKWEARKVSKDGRVFWVRETARAFTDIDGRLVVLIVCEDITAQHQAEAALRNSEEWFSRTFNASPVPMVVRRLRDSVYVDVNESFVRSSGYSRQEIVGCSDADIDLWIDVADRSHARMVLQERGRVANLEASVRRKDGTIRTGLFSAEIIFLEGDECALIAMNDITERKQAEEALRKSEERFSKAFWASASPSSITSLEDGRYVDVNESFLSATGYAREEVIGHKSIDLGIWTDPEQRERVVRLLIEGRPLRDFELVYRNKSGGQGVWLLSAELMEIDGERYIVATRNDITERKRAEERLRASEERFSKAFHGSPVPMSISKNQRFIDVNASFVATTGYSRDEVIGRTLDDLGLWPDEKERDRVVRTLKDGGGVQNLEVRYRMKGGQTRTFLMSTDVIEVGGTRCVLAVTNDITDRKQAEEALRESEGRVRRLVESNIIGIIIADFRGGVTVANDAFLRIVGYTRQDLQRGLNWKDLTPREYQERDLQAIEELKVSGVCAPFEKEYRRKDETRVPVLVGVALLEGSSDTTIAFVLDLSEQRRAQQGMQESERRFRALIEHSSDAIALVNAEGKVFYASPSTSRILGYRPEELFGRHPFELAHADDLSDIKAAAAKLITKPGNVVVQTHRAHHKDGTWRWIEAVSTNLISEPSVRAIVVNYRDVTERRHAEEEQSQLQAIAQKVAREWRLTFDAVEFPILLVDMDCTVVRLNRAAMLLSGKDYREIKGRAAWSIGPGEPWRRIGEMVNLVKVSRSSMTNQTFDESTGKTWEIAASLFSGFELDDAKVIVLARDITGMVELQESLRRSETMSAMGQLVAGVAHEVRNPLFGISATLDAFAARFGEPEEYRQYINVLRGEVGRLSDLMRDLLEYGRPLNQKLTTGTLETVISQAILECRVQAERAGVRITNRVGDKLSDVLMDRGRLLQVFRNLIENAIQHSPDGAEIVVDCHRACDSEQPGVECSIQDSGPGFRPEDISKVFDPFFTRRRGGTGLGLSIAHRIVEEHRGTISVANNNGCGAVVIVKFPVVKNPAGTENQS